MRLRPTKNISSFLISFPFLRPSPSSDDDEVSNYSSSFFFFLLLLLLGLGEADDG